MKPLPRTLSATARSLRAQPSRPQSAFRRTSSRVLRSFCRSRQIVRSSPSWGSAKARNRNRQQCDGRQENGAQHRQMLRRDQGLSIRKSRGPFKSGFGDLAKWPLNCALTSWSKAFYSRTRVPSARNNLSPCPVSWVHAKPPPDVVKCAATRLKLSQNPTSGPLPKRGHAMSQFSRLSLCAAAIGALAIAAFVAVPTARRRGRGGNSRPHRRCRSQPTACRPR